MQTQARYPEETNLNQKPVMQAWAQRQALHVNVEEMITLVRKAVYPRVLRLRYGASVLLSYHDDHKWAFQTLAALRGE